MSVEKPHAGSATTTMPPESVWTTLTTKGGAMRVVKLHRYGVRSNALGDGRLALEAPGKPRLERALAAA